MFAEKLKEGEFGSREIYPNAPEYMRMVAICLSPGRSPLDLVSFFRLFHFKMYYIEDGDVGAGS